MSAVLQIYLTELAEKEAEEAAEEAEAAADDAATGVTTPQTELPAEPPTEPEPVPEEESVEEEPVPEPAERSRHRPPRAARRPSAAASRPTVARAAPRAAVGQGLRRIAAGRRNSAREDRSRPEIPIRVRRATSRSQPASGRSSSNGGWSSGARLCARPTPSAWSACPGRSRAGEIAGDAPAGHLVDPPDRLERPDQDRGRPLGLGDGVEQRWMP